MNPDKNKIILGVDPGTQILGYGIIEINGQELKLLSMGVIHLVKVTNPYEKLQRIYERICNLIDNFEPSELAIEAPFYGKNVQSMLKLGRAQGIAIAAAISKDVPVFEYAPRKIKQSITGNGNASKEQVALMLPHLIKYEFQPKYMDATDGLAIAICHHLQASKINFTGSSKKSTKTKNKNNWDDFLKNNPERII